MPKCERCGKEFDFDEEDVEFDNYRGLALENFNINVCADCAKGIVDAKEDGVYFETCEECGKEFDWFEDVGEFYSRANGADLHDFDRILCCECAMDEWENMETYDEDDDY